MSRTSMRLVALFALVIVFGTIGCGKTDQSGADPADEISNFVPNPKKIDPADLPSAALSGPAPPANSAPAQAPTGASESTGTTPPPANNTHKALVFADQKNPQKHPKVLFANDGAENG